MGEVGGERRVFVTRDLRGLGSGDPLAPLRAIARVDVWERDVPPPADEMRARTGTCEGLLCLLTDSVDESLLAACPGLRVISSMSVGVDHINLEVVSGRGIPVGHTPGVLVETTADLAFGMLLAASRRIVEADRFVREGRWTPDRRWAPDMLLGADVHGATLGVVGLGAIGRAVAVRARGFGMRVLGWSRSARKIDGVESVPLDALLAGSDFVTIHVALAAETRGLFDAQRLALMKPGAGLVNAARGGIVDEQALAEALSSGHLGFAALDVFDDEPLPQTSPLLGAPNLVLAPHIGSASVATRRRMADLAVENLIAGLEGRPMLHCANEGDL